VSGAPASAQLGYVPVISFREGIGGLFAPAPERPHGTERARSPGSRATRW
jgi:hypothetical protein